MFLAVNTIEQGKWAGELTATILFAVAAIIGLIYAHRVTKKKNKPKPEDTLPKEWRDRFFS